MSTQEIKVGDELDITFSRAVVLSVDRGHIEVQTAHAEFCFNLNAPDVSVTVLPDRQFTPVASDGGG